MRMLYNGYMILSRTIYAHAKSIFEIDVEWFKKHNVKTLLVDLDNTLDSFKLYTPTEKAIQFKEVLSAAGINLFIISNNRGKRVSSYAKALGVDYICCAGKPFAGKLKRLIRDKNWNVDELMMAGDQTLTDAGAANKANIRFILTDKIVEEDQWTTHFNRLIDRPIRRHLTKKGKMIDWRTL